MQVQNIDSAFSPLSGLLTNVKDEQSVDITIPVGYHKIQIP